MTCFQKTEKTDCIADTVSLHRDSKHLTLNSLWGFTGHRTRWELYLLDTADGERHTYIHTHTQNCVSIGCQKMSLFLIYTYIKFYGDLAYIIILSLSSIDFLHNHHTITMHTKINLILILIIDDYFSHHHITLTPLTLSAAVSMFMYQDCANVI